MDLKKTAQWITTWWGMWLVFFIYTAASAAFVQLVLIPHFLPAMDRGHGLFSPDAEGFSWVAMKQVAAMMKDGWKAWQLFPKNQYPAGMASIFYYLWCPEPFTLIPFNAALHATAGCLVFFLISSFIEDRMAAFGGAALFVFNPASLEWTAQIHKDGTFILGNLLFLVSWLLISKSIRTGKWRALVCSAVTFFMGVLMIWLTRPYWTQVVLAAFVFMAATMFFLMLAAWHKRRSIEMHQIASLLLVSIMLVTLAVVSSKAKASSFSEVFEKRETDARILEQAPDGIVIKLGFKARVALKDPASGRVIVPDFGKPSLLPQSYIPGYVFIEGPFKTLFLPDKIVWRVSPFMPNFIDSKLNGLSKARLGVTTTGGKSLIDPEVQFMSVTDFILYIPRALQVGYLSPFPLAYFEHGSTAGTTVGRTVLGIITMFFYVCIAVLVCNFRTYYKSHNFRLIVLWSTYGVLIFTYVYPNIGTLNRIRYGFFMTIVSIGFAFAIMKVRSTAANCRGFKPGAETWRKDQIQ